MPSRYHVYDVVVVGAGVEGSAAAYYAAKNKASTLLLEQFALPHSRGSSHGQTRIIRKAYDKSYYSTMMGEAYEMWKELEKMEKTKLYLKTGLVNIGETGEEFIESTQKSLDAISSKYETLGPEKLRLEYPQFKLDQNKSAVYDPDAGVLFADRALTTLQAQFRKEGGILKDGEKVQIIQPGKVLNVRTTGGTYRCKSVIIAAGAWTNKLLRHLGLQLMLQTQKIDVFYWKEKSPVHAAHQGFPAMIYSSPAEGHDVYALPAHEYPGLVKVCSHVGPRVDPDARDKDAASTQGTVAQFIRQHMPELEDTPSITEACMYTLTPDSDFIIDKLPKHDNIVVAAGFSGHGFKMAPVVGKLLYELASQKPTSYDIKPFRITRFPNTSSKL